MWKEPDKAQKVMTKKNVLQLKLKKFNNIESEFNDLKDLASISKGSENDSLVKEIHQNLIILKKVVSESEVETLLSGEADSNDCYLEINAGAGGTESQDWASMLLRMYSRWVESKKFKITLLQVSEGEEAGIKSVSIKIEGHNAYGLLKTESGVHRLVRISPFDTQKRRHTSFSSVWVYPSIDKDIEIKLEEKDIRVDTYRASGAGGQHINKTDSAIRLTHIPTSIVVQCQNQRSQHQNRASAYKMLKSRLYELELRKEEEKKNKTEQLKKEIGWGSQIRSYVLQPYQMIKDLRTGAETSDTESILDGNIDYFISVALSQKIK